ncbi:MAG: hypothetical protein IKO93_01265, partial [Lentisphaeria bacterium]|nr:hypothetical protein [Lentisphaeria bacterium]
RRLAVRGRGVAAGRKTAGRARVRCGGRQEDGWPCEGGVWRELIGPIRLIGPIGESAETEMTSAAADAEIAETEMTGAAADENNTGTRVENAGFRLPYS